MSHQVKLSVLVSVGKESITDVRKIVLTLDELTDTQTQTHT